MRWEFWHQLFVFEYFMKLTRRCHSYFTSPMFFHKAQLVSSERRTTRRHTGDALLCYRVCLSFVAVWLSKEQWLLAFPRIPLPSNMMKIHQNLNYKWQAIWSEV